MSSYIAFDLDALNRAPAVARAAGIREEDVIAGLVRLWAWCFREEQDRVTTLQVRGHFGTDCAEALAAFGFLEPVGNVWRVRGAARYLRVKTAQRDAAKRTNERRQQRAEEQRSSDAPPHGPPSGQPTPLHRAPTTEHRTPTTEGGAPADSPSLVDRVTAVFAEERNGATYTPSPADERAVMELLRLSTGNTDEIVRRFRIALRRNRYPTCHTLRELADGRVWNAAAQEDTGPPAKPKDVTRGAVRAEDIPETAHRTGRLEI